LSPTTYLVNLVGDAGSGSGTSGDIRYCINQADNPANAGSTITFDTTALGSNAITLTKGQLVIAANMTITGPGASKLTLNGNHANRVFDIASTTAQVTISGLTISGGSAAYGGGIVNQGSLTVSDSMLSANSARIEGGGICNIGGKLTVNGSSLSGNTATSGGGGLYNNGSLTLSSSTLPGNSAFQGGGVFNAGIGTLAVNTSTLDDNSAQFGAGFSNRGTLTVSDSVLSGNSAAQYTGGIDNGGSLTVTNSTVAGNSAAYVGGLFNASGTATLTNATIAQNSASVSVGGIDAYSGEVLLHNTLVAGNVLKNSSVDKASDVAYSLDSASDYNLIGDGRHGLSPANHDLLGSPTNLLNPLLAPLGDYGGPTPSMALSPGSPAIDAGSSSYGGSTDQRIKPRVGATDIGAFESQGFTIAASSGNNQSAIITNSFTQPLVVTVIANNPVEPVSDAVITFTAPSSRASAVLSSSTATTGSDGKASITATATTYAGTYTVSASVTDIATTAKFSLSNTTPGSLVVSTLLDENNPAGTNSLREAIAYADTLSGPHTITFDKSILTKPNGNVIDLQSALPDLTANITIEGPGASVLTVQRDDKDAAFRIFTVDAGATTAISGLTVSGGSVSTDSLGEDAGSDGGGIYNAGSLTVSDCTLSGNSASNGIGTALGGGIYNQFYATLTVSDCTLSGNSTTGAGGGICNDTAGSLTVSDCTLSDNTAGACGGIFNFASLTVSNCTISRNTGSGIETRGGAIVSNTTFSGNSLGIRNTGGLSVSDCTLSGNTSGGIYDSGGLTVSDCTLSGNAGDGINLQPNVYCDVLLHNTLIAGNLSGSIPSDVVGGSLDSASDYNLIGDGSGGLSTSNHNLLGSSSDPLNPLLAPLGNYDGATQTIALLPGSPAIEAGSSVYENSSKTDQRGKPIVGAPDIGAFESQGFTIAVSSGNNQSAAINTAFANPLVVSVIPKNAAEPVAGGAITFTAPGYGASAVLKGSPATIGSDGKASVTATANGTTGTYTVSATAIGIASPAKFSLTNTAAASPAIMASTPAATMAAAPSPQETSDLVMAELGQSWDLLLAGDNVHVLTNNPQSVSLAKAIDANPLYCTPAGSLLAIAQ
jgi:hypothetical protein